MKLCAYLILIKAHATTSAWVLNGGRPAWFDIHTCFSFFVRSTYLEKKKKKKHVRVSYSRAGSQSSAATLSGFK